MLEKKDYPDFAIFSGGVNVSKAATNNKKVVEVEVMETMFSIAIYAHP